MMTEQQQPLYSEKEILADALAAEKTTTEHYNLFANECMHQGVRNAILDCLDKEQSIQQDVFQMMHAKGFYPVPEAQPQKVEQARQRFSQCVQQF